MTPTPKPDAAPLSAERLAEVRRAAKRNAALDRWTDNEPARQRRAETVLALLAEREEARRLLEKCHRHLCLSGIPVYEPLLDEITTHLEKGKRNG